MLNNDSWLEQAPKMRLIISSGFLTDRNIGISLASLASPPQEIQGVKQCCSHRSRPTLSFDAVIIGPGLPLHSAIGWLPCTA
jgi:hypothetical protein